VNEHASPPLLNSPDLLAGLSGQLTKTPVGRVHRLAVRVYYEDTDFSGVAYHASYVRWCERGRSDFLRLAGNDHKALFDGSSGEEPAALMVRRLTIDYIKPARIDDVLVVITSVKAMAAATMTLDQRVVRIDPARPDTPAIELCRAEVLVVLVSQSGRVLRLAKRLGNLFQS
jgi:acyl-CoA thioester hydrolase